MWLRRSGRTTVSALCLCGGCVCTSDFRLLPGIRALSCDSPFLSLFFLPGHVAVSVGFIVVLFSALMVYALS